MATNSVFARKAFVTAKTVQSLRLRHATETKRPSRDVTVFAIRRPMIPWTKRGTARTPDGTEIALFQRGNEFVVRAGAIDLMSTRTHASEEILAEQGCTGLGDGACVLIGGLGLGFSLGAAERCLPAGARIVVAELVPAVVDWVRGLIGGEAWLSDPRVVVDLRDAAVILNESEARFDAILLDVDNGPSAVSQDSNRWLYGRSGLLAAARALRPGGRLAVWSAGDDPSFERRLESAGFAPRTVHARAHREKPESRGRGVRHTIFIGTRRSR